MKGAIMHCLGELIKSNYGNDKWEDSLEKAGISRKAFFMPGQNVEDASVIKVIQSVCGVLKISPAQAADAFGSYWVNTYAPKLYGEYYKGSNSAKEFLLKMDGVHEKVTKSISDAHPPRFEYEWKNDKTLVVTYKSHRGLIDICIGLIKGVGKYFKENLDVTKLGSDKIQIIFSN